MTKEEIIRMAREAGFRFSDEEDPLLANHAEWQRQLFERFANHVAAAEREACARMAEAFHQHGYDFTGDLELHEAIRARGQA